MARPDGRLGDSSRSGPQAITQLKDGSMPQIVKDWLAVGGMVGFPFLLMAVRKKKLPASTDEEVEP